MEESYLLEVLRLESVFYEFSDIKEEERIEILCRRWAGSVELIKHYFPVLEDEPSFLGVDFFSEEEQVLDKAHRQFGRSVQLRAGNVQKHILDYPHVQHFAHPSDDPKRHPLDDPPVIYTEQNSELACALRYALQYAATFINAEMQVEYDDEYPEKGDLLDAMAFFEKLHDGRKDRLIRPVLIAELDHLERI